VAIFLVIGIVGIAMMVVYKALNSG